MKQRALCAAALLLLAASPVWADDDAAASAIVCDKPPSAEDLSKALSTGAVPAGCHKRKSRHVHISVAPEGSEGSSAQTGASGAPDVTAPAPAAAAAPAADAAPPSFAASTATPTPALPAAAVQAPAPVAASAAKPAPAAGPGTNVVALPVHFNFGSAVVATDSRAYIEVVGQLLQRDPNLSLLIEGHTDAVGNGRSNMMLSWERAFAVFRTLVEQYGIDPVRLRPIGKGSTEPLPDSAPTDAENRRVQFRVLG